MPVISSFYGLMIEMFFKDVGKHKQPHIHARYQNFKAVFSIPDGEILGGELPPKKTKLVQAWISLHEEELMSDWDLAVVGSPVFPIQPLH